MKPFILPPLMSATAWTLARGARRCSRAGGRGTGARTSRRPDPGRRPSAVPCLIGIPSAPGIRPEVRVERAVLLHDDHDVLDLVDPLTRAC